MYRKYFFVIVLCNFVLKISSSGSDVESDVLQRSRRQLLFPNSTLYQLTVGLGTPSPAKLINVNWAIQANFQLPWNRSQIPFDILETDATYTGVSRRKRELNEPAAQQKQYYQNDAKLYHFYKYIEDVLNGYGHNGTSCVLRTLCHLAAEPLHVDDDEDVLHEIASFVLNPENDRHDDGSVVPEATLYIDALKAENVQQCFNKYDCSIPLIDLRIHDSLSKYRHENALVVTDVME
ncbi:PREDICTED: uncharacterized protein LOC106119261 [Papilio xuthus]|uniref:Uncharacterized protein LOC106119261 n=1 Tax=Papilio xuthus TaxID=66420 RepID=A0AAJ6ZCG3_PAPXU|nr:PREDICTED: uncharacterized protein LOC106119261 [Papilio xuthus]